MSAERPMPDVRDPLVASYWAQTRQGRLVIPRCVRCGYELWPPEPVCPECLQEEFEWIEIDPTGTLWSYAVYHRALDPGFADQVPYAVVLVELVRGLKMYGLFRGEPASLEIGARMVAVFERASDEVTFVSWRRDDAV